MRGGEKATQIQHWIWEEARPRLGSQVCDRHGIYAASRALRHASVAVTAGHYVDKKSKVTSGLGAALSERIVELKHDRRQTA